MKEHPTYPGLGHIDRNPDFTPANQASARYPQTYGVQPDGSVYLPPTGLRGLPEGRTRPPYATGPASPDQQLDQLRMEAEQRRELDEIALKRQAHFDELAQRAQLDREAREIQIRTDLRRALIEAFSATRSAGGWSIDDDKVHQQVMDWINQRITWACTDHDEGPF